MEITVNGKSRRLSGVAELQSLIEEVFSEEYQEIWISGPQASQLCIMLNPSSAFAMYLRDRGDSGFRTHNSQYEESEAVETFRLANGQVDYYPKSWVIEKGQAKAVMETFLTTGLLDSQVNWKEEE